MDIFVCSVVKLVVVVLLLILLEVEKSAKRTLKIGKLFDLRLTKDDEMEE